MQIAHRQSRAPRGAQCRCLDHGFGQINVGKFNMGKFNAGLRLSGAQLLDAAREGGAQTGRYCRNRDHQAAAALAQFPGHADLQEMSNGFPGYVSGAISLVINFRAINFGMADFRDDQLRGHGDCDMT